jgi:hypothetical protein
MLAAKGHCNRQPYVAQAHHSNLAFHAEFI